MSINYIKIKTAKKRIENTVNEIQQTMRETLKRSDYRTVALLAHKRNGLNIALSIIEDIIKNDK